MEDFAFPGAGNTAKNRAVPLFAGKAELPGETEKPAEAGNRRPLLPAGRDCASEAQSLESGAPDFRAHPAAAECGAPARGALSPVMAVFLQRLQDGRAILHGDFVVQLHVQGEAALGQIQRLDALAHMVEDLAPGGKGEHLAVEIQIDGDRPVTNVYDNRRQM